MSSVHKSIFLFLPEPNTLYKASKLQEIQSHGGFPWSVAEQPVAQPYLLRACRRCLLHKRVSINGFEIRCLNKTSLVHKQKITLGKIIYSDLFSYFLPLAKTLKIFKQNACISIGKKNTALRKYRTEYVTLMTDLIVRWVSSLMNDKSSCVRFLIEPSNYFLSH